jgi:hypothetical protein
VDKIKLAGTRWAPGECRRLAVPAHFACPQTSRFLLIEPEYLDRPHAIHERPPP